MSLQYRPAQPDDAQILAWIIAETSGGIVDYLLSDLIPGISAQELLQVAIRDEDNVYSYQNALLATWNEQPVGLLLAYPGEENQLPATMLDCLLGPRLDPLRSILFHQDQHGLYINTFWVQQAWRGTGLADTLLDIAEALALDQQRSRLCLHVWADNTRALRFYQRRNFHCSCLVPTPEHPCLPAAQGKFLMHKEQLQP